jgi:hypothetical protein
MAFPIEKWAKQAVARELRGDFEPVPSLSVWDDIRDAATLARATWREKQYRLVAGGEPLNMPEGTYGGLLAYPPAGTITTTSINGTVNLYPNLTFAPLPLNSFLTPQAYRIAIVGKHTTGLTPGNLGINPLINTAGTWTTGGTAVSGGTTMGASSTVTGTASITNSFFYLVGDLTIRSLGAPGGANASIVGLFHCSLTHPTAGPTTVPATGNLLFGGTAVSIDLVTAATLNSLQFGGVHTTTAWTWNIEQLHFMDWN